MENIKNHQSKQRFSHTVEYYVKYRPHYPEALIEILKKQGGLESGSVVADIGSGTGIFTKLLLENGCRVFAVEPNGEMQKAALMYLSDYDAITHVKASAENTTLSDHSVDIITVAQAFHWFSPLVVKKEFKRILKPNGFLVLLWNLREATSDFMQAYEALLQTFGTDYKAVCAEGLSEAAVQDFFLPGKVDIQVLPNEQVVDWEGFRGRLLSTSYVPKPGAENFNAMLDQAEKIFHQYQRLGKVRFIYQTKLYIGKL